MKSTQKFLGFWLFTMFPSMLIAMITQASIAINICLLLLLMLGAVMIFSAIYDQYFNIICKWWWPKTKFTVKGSKIRNSGYDGPTSYQVYFDLEYMVNNTPYIQDYHDLNIPIHDTHEEAKEYIAQVKNGVFGTEIYFNPVNPWHSYINPGLKFLLLLNIAIGILLASVAYFTLTGAIVWE